ncbi:MAG: hypothetical protein KGZ97_06295 [Bacteroidetes bacterium]|nr:hypothetical protein [Bacteroidota bacterium]
MKKVAYILLVIIGFLFLHSETGIFKDCEDHHAGHDVCAIFQKSDNTRNFRLTTSLISILQFCDISNFLELNAVSARSFSTEQLFKETYPYKPNKILLQLLKSILI